MARFRLGIKKICFHGKDCKILEQTAQEISEVTIPGSVTNTCVYDSLEHSLMVNMVVVVGWWYDLMIFKHFSIYNYLTYD